MGIRRHQDSKLRFSFACPVLGRSFCEELLQKAAKRLGKKGGAQALREHQWFKKPKPFDFDALHSRSMPSPMEIPWQSPEITAVGHFDQIDEDDDIYVHYVDDGSGW